MNQYVNRRSYTNIVKTSLQTNAQNGFESMKVPLDLLSVDLLKLCLGSAMLHSCVWLHWDSVANVSKDTFSQECGCS